ncbi:MAG: hypothetical protein ACYCYE_15285 [Clostridia bacterium]
MREGLASILVFGVFAASFILKEAFIMQTFRLGRWLRKENLHADI